MTLGPITPTYVKEEIEANPIWELAWTISQIVDDNAPLDWGKHRILAECLLHNYEIKRKPQS